MLSFADLDAPGLGELPWEPLEDSEDEALLREHLVATAREGLLYRLDHRGEERLFALHEGALRELPQHPAGSSWAQWWATCPNGAALLQSAWPLVARQRIVWAACQVVRSVLHLAEADPRPRRCVETAERWSRGRATEEELTVARIAAWSCAANTRVHEALHWVASAASRCAVRERHRPSARSDARRAVEDVASGRALAPHVHGTARNEELRERALLESAMLVRSAEHGIPFTEAARGLLGALPRT